MENNFWESEKQNNVLINLIVALLLAVGSALFVNCTIGAMGGIPFGIALFFAYYWNQKRMHHLTDRMLLRYGDDEGQVKHRTFVYTLQFLLLWLPIRAICLLVQYLGWGNIEGFRMKDYLQKIYGSTLIELWAYFFAMILVFAFASSLMPLTAVKNKRNWLGYFVADYVFFIAIISVIKVVCKIWIRREQQNKVERLMDALYLCVTPYKWQAGLFLAIVGFVCLIIIYISYRFTLKFYKKKELIQTQQNERNIPMYKLIVLVVVAILVIIVGIVGLAKTLVSKKKKEPTYQKVAECLTYDEEFGPIAYNSEIYIPVHLNLEYHNNHKPLGYIAHKGENVNSKFYRLTEGNLLYQGVGDTGKYYLEMYGEDYNTYKLAEKIEESEEWKTNQLFVLWDEKWKTETAYSKDMTGYSICEKELIEQLEAQFGNVEYRMDDFLDYDAYFTIISYASPKEAFGEEGNAGAWVGCILVKDNEFYYGNYQNQIQGDTLDALLDVLGGNQLQLEADSELP